MINKNKNKDYKLICARIIDENNNVYRGKIYKNAGFAKSGIRPDVCYWIRKRDFNALKTNYVQTVYENGYIEKEPLIHYAIDIVKKEIKELNNYLKTYGENFCHTEKELMLLEDILEKQEKEKI